MKLGHVRPSHSLRQRNTLRDIYHTSASVPWLQGPLKEKVCNTHRVKAFCFWVRHRDFCRMKYKINIKLSLVEFHFSIQSSRDFTPRCLLEYCRNWVMWRMCTTHVSVFCFSTVLPTQDGWHSAVQGDHSSEEGAAQISVHTRYCMS